MTMSMINEEEHVSEKFARGQEGVTGCRSVSQSGYHQAVSSVENNREQY